MTAYEIAMSRIEIASIVEYAYAHNGADFNTEIAAFISATDAAWHASIDVSKVAHMLVDNSRKDKRAFAKFVKKLQA